MKVIVIPDIHLKPQIFDRVDRIMYKYDITESVFVGDIVDDWGKSDDIELVKETLDRAIKFKKDHPSCKFCWGNHEVGYITGIYCSGNSEIHYIDIRDMIKEYEKKVQPRIAFKIDNVIFSHAGFTETYKSALEILNSAKEYNEKLYECMSDTGSPLWVRPDEWIKFCNVTQVVGHTPVETITQDRKLWIVDTHSTLLNGEHYGDQSFLVIDTKTLTAEIYGVDEWISKTVYANN